MQIAKLIRRSRKALGLRRFDDFYDCPQAVTARELGVGRRTLARWESKQGPGRWGQLVRYALIGLLYADGLDPRSIRGLVPERPEQIERWRRDVKGTI